MTDRNDISQEKGCRETAFLYFRLTDWNMYELFFKKFAEKVPLTDEEAERIKSYLTPKKLRRKQYLLQEGDVCKSIAFVEKGLLREYLLDDAGEHIIQFALEGCTIADLLSLALLAIPTPEHYLPLIYTLGLQGSKDSVSFFDDKAVGGSLTMTSVKFG